VEAVNNGLTSSPASVSWTVSTASACSVPYSASSPWNTPISANPTVDPNSASEVATLTTNTSYPKLGSDPTQYTYPVYYATSSTPTVPVWVDQLYSNVTGPNTLHKSTSGTELQVPIPTDAIPANGSDGQIIVLDRSTGDEWGFWQVYNSTDPVTSTVPAGVGTSSNPLAVQNAYADFWVGQQITIGQGTANQETAVIASFPDADHMVLTNPTTKPHNAGDNVWAIGATNGYHYNTTWSGIPPSGFTSRGAGVPYLTGLVRPCEITQGHIDHALAFAYQNTTSQFVSPATKSDGGSSSGMPEGTHLQLDPSISDATIQSWGCTGACFTTAKALQKYGMYLIDSGGHPKVMFEDDSTANWNGTVSASTTNPIPLSDFRVIDG
jgi:hypothetical protein